MSPSVIFPIADLILLVNIDPFPVPMIAVFFVVSHVVYSPVKASMDLRRPETGQWMDQEAGLLFQ
jgi:hypothetical protein